MESPKIQYGLSYRDEYVLGYRKHIEMDGKEWFQLVGKDEGEPWLVDDIELAIMTKWSSENYINSSYDEPVNPYHSLDLQVIKIVTITTVADSDPYDEVNLVNEKLKAQGYATLDFDKVFGRK
jgi:hypothetical protein